MEDLEPGPAGDEHAASVGVAALTGTLCAALALAVGEFADALSPRLESFVIAVGDVFVDLTPGPLVRTSIETLGMAQKAVLLGGITVGTLAVGALTGILAPSHRRLSLGVIAALTLFGGWATSRSPLTSPAWSWAVVAIAACAAAGALHFAPGPVRRRAPPPDAPDDPRIRYADRRGFLEWAGGMSVASVALVGVGRTLLADDTVQVARRRIVLPTPATTTTAGTTTTVTTTTTGPESTTTPPTTTEAGFPPTEDLSPYLTPNPDFYRIDTALAVPVVDPGDWKLSVTGMVDEPYDLTYDEILDMDLVEETVTLACVSNEVGGTLVGNAVWTGVPLAGILERARPQPAADQILGLSVDGFTAGFPLELATDGRTAMLAVGMNGEPLPLAHGFPARLVVAGLYGYVSAVKWLSEVVLDSWEGVDGFWIPRGWAKEAPIKISSRIDTPRTRRLSAGRQPVAGVAWAPLGGIAAVEVSIDAGPWQPCRLGEAASGETWVQWLHTWDAQPGEHRIEVRATGRDGLVQPAEPVPPAPNGAEGHHVVRVSVA